MLKKIRTTNTFLLFLAISLFSVITNAQGVDTTYSPVPGPGTVAMKAITLQADGKAIVSGAFTTIDGTTRVSIARLNTDGTLDTSFNPGTGFDGDVTKLFVQPDGKIIAFGTFTTYNSTARAKLARINSDGSLDTTFTPTIANVNNIKLQPDGKVVLLGTTVTVNGAGRTGVARLNLDGTLDTSFLVILGDPTIHDCVFHSDGRITVVGVFNGANGNNNRINSARFFSDGTLDTTFNGGVGTFHRVALQADGKYIFASIGEVLPIWRFGADGLPQDTTFNSGNVRSGGVESINVKADGSIILAGSFTSQQQGILRLDSTGSRDVQFAAPGTNGVVNGVALQADQKIIAVGAFTSIAGVTKPGIARLNSSAFAAQTPFDFDGDGRADISVTRPGDFMWYQLTGPNYFYSATQLGATGDKVAPADYDGDGRTDIAVVRMSTGEWKYLSSRNSTLVSKIVSAGADVPLPADYTGDGRADFAVIRNNKFEIVDIATNQTVNTFNATGQTGDQPIIGDFDGDRKIDKAFFRPATGQWIYYPSTNGGSFPVAVHWGNSDDVAVPADYDGDGKTDFAVFRTTEGNWYVLNSSNGSFTASHFGATGDKPIPADFDGDGKTDIAVFRPSEGFWYLLLSTGGYTGFPWGLATDIPTPAAYLP